jgi:hypothetical protein
MRFRNANVPSVDELLSGLGLDPRPATSPPDFFATVDSLTRPPQEITEDVQSFARQLSPDRQTCFVPIDTAAWAESNECFAAVEKKIEQDGGEMVHGWGIAEWPNIRLVAEFHVVWRSEEGELLDVSVHPPEHETTLFVPAQEVEYTGKLVPSRFYKLWESDVLDEWRDLHQEQVEIRNRNFHDGVTVLIAGQDAKDHERFHELERYRKSILLPLVLERHFCVNG